MASSPVFLPGKFYGQRSLASYSPWGRKESDTTERLSTHTHTHTHILYKLTFACFTCNLTQLGLTVGAALEKLYSFSI